VKRVARARILIVDDEPSMLRSVERVLSPEHDVRGARSAQQGLEIAREFHPDLALLDVRMPDRDGFALMAELKREQPDLDVILMTGSVHDPDSRLIRAIRERAFYFLYKPFDRDVLRTLVERCLEARRLTDENRRSMERMASELDAARSFQRSLLPGAESRVGPFRITARYLPSAELGGDFYDLIDAGGGDLALLVGDVSGHGVSAAMLTASLKLAFRSASGSGYAPDDVIRRVAESLAVFGPRRFVSALAARISARDGGIVYVNAGHPPAARVGRDGTCHWLDSTAPIVHPVLEVRTWGQGRDTLGPGERLVLYTDGLIEAHGADGPFATERLEAELRAATRDGREPVAAVLDRLDQFTGGRPLEDDVALVAVTRDG
jgi:sigma-B regulation protein RsbU (phosphoserine phosphatase)